jgi:hypothetical protein
MLLEHLKLISKFEKYFCNSLQRLNSGTETILVNDENKRQTDTTKPFILERCSSELRPNYMNSIETSGFRKD